MSNWIARRIENYKLVTEKFDKFLPQDMSAVSRLGYYLDFFLEAKLHHIQLIDYIQYQLYKKKNRERRTFVCFGEYTRLYQEANDPAYYPYFDDKDLFNKTFAKYMGRKWLDVGKCSFQEFCEFVDSVESFFVKPNIGSWGEGTAVVKNDGTLDKEALYEKYKASDTLLEEVVQQHAELAAFNESSVNTIRIVTFLTADGTVKIMPSIIRLGRAGQVVDNFHNFGIVSLIDVDTGILKTTGVDYNYTRYVLHPDSGKPIVGFKIPNWDKIVETVKEAALVIPQVRYIGWDVAVGKNGEVIFIEGNKSADPDASQVTDQIGKWPDYLALLEELKQAGLTVK